MNRVRYSYICESDTDRGHSGQDTAKDQDTAEDSIQAPYRTNESRLRSQNKITLEEIISEYKENTMVILPCSEDVVQITTVRMTGLDSGKAHVLVHVSGL